MERQQIGKEVSPITQLNPLYSKLGMQKDATQLQVRQNEHVLQYKLDWKDNQTQLFVKKIREKEYDQKIINQWKVVRSQLYDSKKRNQSNEQQITQALENIDLEYQKKSKQCLPIQFIIKNKINSLTYLHIQYQKSLSEPIETFRYSTSAFSLFKVIQENIQLKNVILKGVKIQEFQQFIQMFNPSNNFPVLQQKQSQVCWMRKFKPLKSLKLCIEAAIQFLTPQQEYTASLLKDLAFFSGMFYQLSDMKAKIKFGSWSLTNEARNLFVDMWRYLRTIKNISIQIWIIDVPAQLTSTVRSILFGELASFTEIAQLSFIGISFNRHTSSNDLLAIQECLCTIFENNLITGLNLNWCQNFPIFPQINTLSSIQLQRIYFRRQFAFMGTVPKIHKSLKSIRLQKIEQEWKINEQLLDQLERLNINFSYKITFSNRLSQSFTNIKHLQLQSMSFESIQLNILFPKLANLTYLSIFQVDIGYSTLGLIPSLHLEYLHIQTNEAIGDNDLKEIDLRWPELRELTISDCAKITKNVWTKCNFKGLVKLNVQHSALQSQSQACNNLKRKGILLSIF